MRLLLFTGKGGAGKTTVAAATALLCAAGGWRTLLAGLDGGDAIGDVLGQAAEREPTPVLERLWAQRIDTTHEMPRRWPALARWLDELASWRTDRPATGAGIAALPGVAELVALLTVGAEARSGAYDALIVDCPPAGALMRLLVALDELPQWLDRFPRSDGPAARWTRPLLRHFADLPVPDETVGASARDLRASIDAVRRLLTDPSVSSFRLVCTPERLSMREAQRAYAALTLFDCQVDALVVNGVADPSFAAAINSGEESSSAGPTPAPLRPLPALCAAKAPREPEGIATLTDLADRMYHGCDPLGVLAPALRRTVTRDETGALLRIPLPGIRGEDVSVSQAGDTITVGTGSVRRCISLPASLLGMTCSGAHYDGVTLRLPFRPRATAGAL